MPSGADDVDRLRAAIEAHERFVGEQGLRSVSEFLAEHEELRELLEPLLGQGRPSPPPHAASERVLGDFRLLRELGRGGMGVVYDAEQISLGRRVAVKVLPGRLALDPDRRARFERESRLAASLDHPGIAKVISADADGDVIWFAMERIDGAPLDRVLRRTAGIQPASMTGDLLEAVVDEVALRQSLGDPRQEASTGKPESTVWRRAYVDTVVRIGAQIAEALQHAHQHGVIHRDVKPGNLLLRRDGSAVLTDFGLARELNAPSLTLAGDFLGTPSYSAPEQLSDDRAAVDHRADVFALGVTLYELLTHRRPFEASTADEVRTRILTVEPPPPRRANPKIPSDLSSVLLKALEKDPGQRYQSAAAMAEDLRAVAQGRPVRAVSVRPYKRAWRWCRRNPTATTALVSMLGVVLLLLTIRGQLVRANAEQAKNTVRTGIALARAQDFHGALAGLMPLERQSPRAATQAALDELFRRYPCLVSYPLIREAGERVVGAIFSPDSRWVVTTHMLPNLPEQERWHLRLWRVPSPNSPAPQPLWTWRSEPSGRPLWPVHVTSGETIAWVLGDRTVALGGPNRKASYIEFPQQVRSLAQASTAGRVGVVLDEHVQLLDADGHLGREWRLTTDHPFLSVTILDNVMVQVHRGRNDTPWIMTSSARGAAPVDLGTGHPRVQHDPDDPTRMVITTPNEMTGWRAANGELEPDGRRENPLPSRVTHGLMSSEEREPEQMGSHFGHLDELPLQGPTLIARFFPAEAGRSREPFIVAIEDRAMRIWGIPGPQQLVPQEGGLEFVRFEPTGRRLWCVSDEKLVAWSFGAEGVGSRDEGVEQPREIRDAVAEGMGPQFCGIAFDPGRAILACARGDHPRGRVPGWVFVLPDELQGARSYPCSSEPSWVALSPDRTQLAVAEGNGGVELWTYDSELRELTERVALPALGVGAPRLSCVRYLGTRFLLGSAGSHLSAGGILRWDLDDLVAPPVPVAPHGIRRALRCLAVSHDNRLVATGGDDQMVRVMRVIRQGGRPKLDPAWLEDHGAGVYAVAFAARDGELLLASADGHGAVRLWDAETGAQRGHLRDPSNRDAGIFGLDFSPDGRHLAASLRDGRVLLWDMDRPRRCLEGNRDCAAELLRLQAGSR